MHYYDPSSIILSLLLRINLNLSALFQQEAIMLDLLRVISHHRARLATPIRTVQKIYSEAELENIPFADSMYNRGGVTSNRPFLLIEPPYKINGEEKTKNRTARPNGERDGKSTTRPASDTKIDPKVGATSASDSKTKETPTSDNNTDTKTGGTTNLDTKEVLKVGTSPTSDSKTVSKVPVRSASKTDSKVTEPDAKSDNGSMGSALDTPSPKSSSTKQPKNASLGHQKSSKNSTSSSSEIGADKAGGFSTASQGKQESERTPVPKPSMSKPALEENIVLGVALEGSKRTLPIEEDMASPPSHAEVTELELAARCSGQGAPTADKDKKDGQIPSSPSSTSVDQ